MRFNNSQKRELRYGTIPRNQLVGKVVLLIGNDTAVLPKLVLQLAQKGADIALLCRKLPAETIHLIESQMESLGRRLLLLTETEGEILFPNQDTTHSVETLLQKISSAFGRLDVFIDLSAKEESEMAQLEPAPKTQLFQPDWQIRQAILEKLAHVT